MYRVGYAAERQHSQDLQPLPWPRALILDGGARTVSPAQSTAPGAKVERLQLGPGPPRFKVSEEDETQVAWQLIR